ncbi:helix-turn-helix domain-containing protein [Ruminococcus sp. OM05-10BH]|nr:helix-turn-helix domain-containing protein [Ruminococcus sp. OM05-10BH]
MAVFRVERNTGYTVMSNHHLRNKELTLKAKGLLSQMLSLPEDWDYTLAGLSHINRESIDAIRTAVWELEKAGYITRRQGRDEKGKMTAIEYTIYEQPQPPELEKPILENPTAGNPVLENPTTGNPTSENPMQIIKEEQKTNLSKKEKPNTDTQSTHSIPIHSPNPSPLEGQAAAPPERKRKEPNDAYRVYEEIIKDNICYDILKQDMPYDHDRIDEIVDLILETVCTRRRTIRIAGDDYPAELVKSKFMKLDSEHIRFVLDCMRENTTKIRNIKQYLRAALFNAPSTIGNYYTSLVAHDMASGALAPRKPQFGDPDYYSCNEGESL